MAMQIRTDNVSLIHCFKSRFLAVGLLSLVAITGCSSISVQKYDPNSAEQPQGIPFYLTKPMKKITTTTYEFRKLSDENKKVLFSKKVESIEIINIVDKKTTYTINKTKAFAGETKFEFQRTVPTTSGTGDASSADLSIVKTEDKEGITEFLKGLVEGAKSAVEAAKAAKELAKGAGPALFVASSDDQQLIAKLLEKDILVVTSVEVKFEDM